MLQPDFPWDWRDLSSNHPGIQIADIIAHKHLPWEWETVSCSHTVPMSFLRETVRVQAVSQAYLNPEQTYKPWDWTGILQHLDYSESLDLSFLSHLDGSEWDEVEKMDSSLTWQHIARNWKVQWPVDWRYSFPQSPIWPPDEAEDEEILVLHEFLHPDFICAHFDRLEARHLSNNWELPMSLVRDHVSISFGPQHLADLG